MKIQPKARPLRTYALFHVLVIAILCTLPPLMAHAATAQFADDACDPKYYDSLEARAWLEAQREVTQNQNLIFKPDSVLQYTCFDSFMNLAAKNAKNMFSGKTTWGTPPTDMGDALSDSVNGPASSWVESNFNHTLLGGRMKTEENIEDTATPGNYTCGVMKRVWQVAKCMNFVQDGEHDGFFTFKEYIDDPDKRFLPTACSGKPGFAQRLDSALKDDKTTWEEDPVMTYMNLIYPNPKKDKDVDECGNKKGGSGSSVKTGITVDQSTSETKTYDETVCIVPGCHYDPKDKKCVVWKSTK